jgi:hypothetical protein
MEKDINYVTTNKSNRDLDQRFNLREFNRQFEEEIKKDKKMILKEDEKDEVIIRKLPHERSIVDIIINLRETFYKLLELLIDKQNPIPYLFATPERHFSLSILLIVLGSLLLLFSSLMISKK